MTDTDLTTSIYNDAVPGNSNVLYSGSYASTTSVGAGVPIAASSLKFSFFTPDSKSVSSSKPRTESACIPDISLPLVKWASGSKWGSSNSLLNLDLNKTKSYAIVENGQNKFITVSPKPDSSGLISAKTSGFTDRFYIHPYFCSAPKNDSVVGQIVNISQTSSALPFDKCITMMTPSYSNTGTTGTNFLTTVSGKTVIQTSSFINRNSNNITVNPKMYLGTSTIFYNSATDKTSCNNNPYGVRLTIRNSVNATSLNNSLSLTNNIYYINGANGITPDSQSKIGGPISLEPGQVLDISLLKIVTTVSTSFVASNDSSILFIDLDDLLYPVPNMTLTTTNNRTNYYYGNEDQIQFSCAVSSNSINGDNIIGHKLKLYVKNAATDSQMLSSPFEAIINSNGTVSYNITNKTQFPPGNYIAYVYYDSNDVTNATLDSNSNRFPDSKSHYKSGISNEIAFSVGKRPLSVEYKGIIQNAYSLLTNWDFTNWKIYDTESTSANKEITLPGRITAGFWFINENSQTDCAHFIEYGLTSFSQLIFSPRDLIVNSGIKKLKVSKNYWFYITFIPTDNVNNATVDSSYIYFNTETPILTTTLLDSSNVVLTNPTLSYKTEISVNCVLKDTNNNIYDNLILPGTINTSLNANITLPFTYNSTSKTYKSTFSPKSLNLLRYSQTSYSVNPAFNISPDDNYAGLQINSQNNSAFIFNGVELLTTINNQTPNYYDTVNVLSFIQDKTNGVIYSSIDIPYTLEFSLFNQSNSFVTQIVSLQNVNNKYPFSFIPSNLSINVTSNPLSLVSKFVFADSLLSIVQKSNELNISLINPIMVITPKSEINDYHYGQEFSVTLTGISGKNDLGTLYLYGKSTNDYEVAKILNVSANGTYYFYNIDIDLLVEDDVLSSLQNNQVISGLITWVPNNINTYNTVQESFNITLSKTDTLIENVVINNNQCDYTQTINVTGKVKTTYNELVDGVVYLYKSQDLYTVISQSTVYVSSGNNVFSIDVTTSIADSYNFVLKFVPLYNNVYNESLNNTMTNFIQFKKITIVPQIKVYDLTTSLISETTQTTMIYSHNFRIVVSGLQLLENTDVIVKIDDNYISDSLIITNGEISTNGINFVEVNRLFGTQISIVQSKNIVLEFIGYNSSDELKSVYSLSVPSKTIMFMKDTNMQQINSVEIKPLNSENVVTTLNFEQDFNIFCNFNLIRDYYNNIIPITGVLQLYVDSLSSAPLILNNNLTLDNEYLQILENFVSSNYNIYVGLRQFIFQFIPNDINIIKSTSVQLPYSIVASTISDVELILQPLNGSEQTYYSEQFEGTVSYYNIGSTGIIEIYCRDPNDVNNIQLLSSIILTPSAETKNTTLTYNFICNPISFDCVTETTSYSIFVKYLSNNLSKYASNVMPTEYSYSVSKMPVKFSELNIDGGSYLDFMSNNGFKKVGQSLIISGTLKTLNNLTVPYGKMELIGRFVSNEEGMYTNNEYNTLPLTNGTKDLTTNNDYVSLSSNGTFTMSLLLTSTSPLYLNYFSEIQMFFSTNKNYKNAYLEYENEIPGIYSIIVDKQDINSSDVSFILTKSVLTNSYSYPYHEDMLHFNLDVNIDYSILSQSECLIRIVDNQNGTTAGIGRANNDGSINTGVYPVTFTPVNKLIAGVTTTVGHFDLLLNPKTDNISCLSDKGYSAIVYLSVPSSNPYSEELRDSNNNSVVFNIQQTVPSVEISITSSLTNAPIAFVNYEESVNISVKAKPSYPIQPGVNHGINIFGSFYFRNQTNSNNTDGTIINVTKADGSIVNSLVFDSIENDSGSYTTGITVNYAPKNNSDKFINLVTKILAIFVPDSENYSEVITKYNNGLSSASLIITKYTPALELNSIYVYNDVQHSLPVNKVDNSLVYYDNIDGVKYNGVINYDEQFQVTTTLNKNIAGSILYYYSSSNAANATWTLVNPLTQTLTGLSGQSDELQSFTALFNKQLIPIPSNHIYYMKSVFYPTVNDFSTNQSTFYNFDESSLLYFNVYQSNSFGVGKLSWDTENNLNLTKIRSHNSSQTVTIKVSFDFDSSVSSIQRRVEVNFYHTDFESSSNKFHGPIYLDATVGGLTRAVATVTIPATTFKYNSNAYSIRAKFTPVLNDGSNLRNNNYPITIELYPISLVIKPYITTSKTNFSYDASQQLSLDVNLDAGTGITNIEPYTKLHFNISNAVANSYNYAVYSTVNFTGTSVSFPNFQNIINSTNGDLRPGNYILSIYATNDTDSSVIMTEIFTTNFSINKKIVTLTATFDKYNMTYRESTKIYIDIGNYPISVGQVHFAFTNAKDQWLITNRYINSSDLVQVSQNNYRYDIPDISSWLVSGVYKISVNLDNIYYTGSQGDNPDKRLLVNMEQNTAIVLSQTVFDVAYGSNITINSSVKYNNSQIISFGQLKLSVNNSESTNVERNFVVNSSLLNKDINHLVLSYNDSTNNYLVKSLPFQINVIKKTIEQPLLTHNAIDNTVSSFKLTLSGVSESDSITFYKLSSISKLVPTVSASGVYTFNFSDLVYGSNTIYAVIRSSTYDIDSTQVTINRVKYDVTLSLHDTTFNSTYKANSLINIKYKVTKNININEIISNNGLVEFHKIVYDNDGVTVNHDEIIGYSTTINNIASLSQHKLVGNSNTNAFGQYYDNKIKFYAKFIESNDYNDVASTTSEMMSITTKDFTRLLDDNSLGQNYKLGDTITLGYIAVKQSVSSNDSDENVKAKIDAEQAAIVSLSQTNAVKAINQTNYNVADNNYNISISNKNAADAALLSALSEKNTANTELINAQNAVVSAKATLDAATINKDESELAFRTMQEVSKLSVSEISLSSAQNAIANAQTEYNNALNAYNTKLAAYNNIVSEIATKQSASDSASAALKTADTNRDNATVDVLSKENLLNTSQNNYESALVSSKNALQNIKTKQSEIISVGKIIANSEDDYEAKKADYDPKKADYDTKNAAFLLVEPGLSAAKTSAQTAYNSAQTNYDANYTNYVSVNNTNQSNLNAAETSQTTAVSNLASQTNAAFTLGDLTNMWMVIDQQSTNESAQNPFFVVYTLKDNVTANASWYKSKLFYGINAGATAPGLMLLYTGDIDYDYIYPEITNRVKLELNASLSAGLQDSTEIVKALSIQTSSNMNETALNDYNFVFRDFGTHGSNSNSTINFTPTALNNTAHIYADGVQGTNVANGWLFNNSSLTGSGKMPKINWYINYNASEEMAASLAIADSNLAAAQVAKTTSQTNLDTLVNTRNITLNNLNVATTDYNTAKAPVDAAYSVMQASFAIYNPVKIPYESALSDLATKESELVVLQTNEATITSQIPGLKTIMDNAKTALDASNANYTAKQTAYSTAESNNSNASVQLQLSKDKLTVLTNGVTIVQEVNNLLVVKNNKYVILKSYIKYVAILQANPSNVDNIIYNSISQVSSDYDTKYNSWKNAISTMKQKQQTYNSKVTTYNNAVNAVSAAESNRQEKSNIRNTALNTYWNYYNEVWAPSNSENDNARNAANAVLLPIAITSGYVEIYKIIANSGTSMTQIIGKVKPDSRGLVTLSHKLVDIGNVSFHAKLTDLPNYYDAETSNVSINVIEKYDTIIVNNTLFNSELYKIGDNVVLDYSVFRNNIIQTPATDGQLVIYKKVGNDEQLLKHYQINSLNNGVVQHNYTLIDSGIVKFFAKYIYSTNNKEQMGSEQSISVLSKLNTQITDISVSSSPYKLGNTVNIKYQLTSQNTYNVSGIPTSRTNNIEVGTVEFHKCVGSLDEIIGYVTLSSGSNGIAELQYELVDVGLVKFYIVYSGTKDYESLTNINSKKEISVEDKYVVTVTNTTNMSASVSKKLGTIVTLSYNIVYGSVVVNEGIMEIKKTSTLSGTNFVEILGYANVVNGVASFSYKLTDIDCVISIEGKFINSPNYKELPSTTNFANVISVYSKDVSNIVRTSVLKSSSENYKLGEVVVLEYKAINAGGAYIDADGIISIHKIVTNISGRSTDEILYYGSPMLGTGKLSYSYSIDTTDSLSFYATYKESADYHDSVSISESINIIKEYTSATNVLSLSSNVPKYADTIVLTSTISDGFKVINEGVVAFYATILGKPAELVGVSNISANVASFNYIVNDIGSVSFLSIFKNSSNYVDVSSSPVLATVSKRDIASLSLSSVSGMQFDLVNVVATIDYGKEVCNKNLGKIEFSIINNGVTSVANVDVIGNTATYKLYIASGLSFTINAKFLGNEAFNMSSTATTRTFTPTPNNNYKTLTYTETSFPVLTNYYTINATIELNDNAVDEKFMLLNTGFVLFESYNNGVLQPLKTVAVPLINATAQCIVRNESGYTYNVKYVDNVTTPVVTVNGLKVISSM